MAYLRKDAAPAWVAVAGAVTGVIAAICSAPISAFVFGGVTGIGHRLIVAALRQGGTDVFNAALGQGFFSDPIDKIDHIVRRLRDPHGPLASPHRALPDG